MQETKNTLSTRKTSSQSIRVSRGGKRGILLKGDTQPTRGGNWQRRPKGGGQSGALRDKRGGKKHHSQAYSRRQRKKGDWPDALEDTGFLFKAAIVLSQRKVCHILWGGHSISPEISERRLLRRVKKKGVGS